MAISPTEKKEGATAVRSIGIGLLGIAKGLFALAAIVFIWSFFVQPSFLAVIAIWLAIGLVPIGLIGFFFRSIGERSESVSSAESTPWTDQEANSKRKNYAMVGAGILLFLNSCAFILKFAPLFAPIFTGAPTEIGAYGYLCFAVFGIFVSIQLSKSTTWAKVSATIVSFLLMMFSVPIGLVLGGITLSLLAKGWQANK